MANYLKHYINLIRKAQQRVNVDGYSEKHHVFPKSIFGKNSFIVTLTAREHYVAHALLERIFRDRYGEQHKYSKKMNYAFCLMNSANGKGQQRYSNSKLYESAKKRFSINNSGANSRFYGLKRVFSEQHIENMRASRLSGSDHPYYGKKRSPEVCAKIKSAKQNISHDTRIKMSESRKGIVFSDQHKANISAANKGRKAYNQGVSPSDETRLKMSEAAKKKDKSFIDDEYKTKQSKHMKAVWAMRKQQLVGA